MSAVQYLGPQLAEGHVALEEEAWHPIQDLEAPDVLQYQQQVAVHHHEGRGDHGVAPAVAHHPQNARPQEEDERQPADVGDAPGLEVESTAQHGVFTPGGNGLPSGHLRSAWDSRGL